MVHFPGTPSDDVADLLATGGTEVTTIFVAMAARSPAGDDADYLAWHALDHRPEVARVAALQGAQRLVSTPACRAARVAGDGRYDAVDHVMTYLFRSPDGPRALGAVAAALAGAGRMAPRLPTVEIATYELAGTATAPRVLVGADVIAWRPARGVFLLVERGAPSPATLVDVPGVAGVWWYRGTPDQPAGADVDGLQISYCYLDEDPVVTVEHLRPALEPRWSAGGGTPLLAAPFHVPVDFAWDRHLP